MNLLRNSFVSFLAFGIILLLLTILIVKHRHSQPLLETILVDTTLVDNLEEVRSRGLLKVVVDYNSSDYFVYKGRPMGFQYDILKALAEDLDVKLQIIVTGSLKSSFVMLKSRSVDILANNLTITKQRKKFVRYLHPLYQTRQVLVQRSTPRDSIIRNQLDLGHKRVLVKGNSAYYQRLLSLSDEIGESIDIVSDTILGSEQLISMVSDGDIDFTICDENIARLNSGYYRNIDVHTPVSFPQNIAWGVLPLGNTLAEYVDDWVANFVKSSEYKAIYRRYFISKRGGGDRRRNYHSHGDGKISEYDDTIKRIAKESGWDWRMIAAIIYQESKFDPYAESWVGAQGLMQLMPETAQNFDVTDVNDPEQNIIGGIKLLSSLNRSFEERVKDPEERMKFILASYNVGIGHILDARNLATKYGADDEVWDGNVETYILNKSIRKYYTDPVVKWGYCRGKETYNFVREITERYNVYCDNFPEEE